MKKTLRSMFETGTLHLLVLVVALAAAFALSGCVYKGAKVTEGTDLAVGFTVPSSEGVLQMDALNYLTGFRLGVAENARLKVKYTCSETNSYFGIISTCVAKTIDAKVEPCADDAPPSPDEKDEDADDGDGKTEAAPPPEKKDGGGGS